MYYPECKGPFHSTCPIVLGSGSPRRRRLLEALGLSISVYSGSVKELGDSSGLPPDQFTMENAMRKLGATLEACDAEVILCADTCVYCDGVILGKPSSFQDAVNMLKMLDKRWHEVFTSFAVLRAHDNLLKQKTISSGVFIDVISDRALQAYCHTEEPYDKAGGYAIQGYGAFMARRIQGSYTNIVGLPVAETVRVLLDIGAIEPCVTDSKE